jgi:hypothetical protein
VVVVSLQRGLEFDRATKESVTPASTERTADLKVRYFGGPMELDPGKRDALRADARRAIAELNKLPTMLASDVHPSRRTDVAQALRERKLALIGMVWDTDWGDFSKFRNWVNVNDGGTSPSPPGFSLEAVHSIRPESEQ